MWSLYSQTIGALVGFTIKHVTWSLSTVVMSPRTRKTQLPLLLRNLATDILPRICIRGTLFTNSLPSNGCTCNNILHILHFIIAILSNLILHLPFLHLCKQWPCHIIRSETEDQSGPYFSGLVTVFIISVDFMLLEKQLFIGLEFPALICRVNFLPCSDSYKH
jgi:hypothetical protein